MVFLFSFLQLKNLEKSLVALFLTMLSHISARAFSSPAHGLILQIVPSDTNTDDLLHHYAISNDDQNDVAVHSRQRRASYAYPDAESYAPVDGFFEGPNRGQYTQPAFSDVPPGYYERPHRANGPRKNVAPSGSRFDNDGYSGSNSNSKHRSAVRRQEFAGPQGPPPPAPGNKYVYQPLFKYKATHHKHHKLFVPNIFG